MNSNLLIIGLGALTSLLNLTIVYFFYEDYFKLFIKLQIIFQVIVLVLERPIYLYYLKAKDETYLIQVYAFAVVLLATALSYKFISTQEIFILVIFALQSPIIGISTAAFRLNELQIFSILVSQVLRPLTLLMIFVLIIIINKINSNTLTLTSNYFSIIFSIPTVALFLGLLTLKYTGKITTERNKSEKKYQPLYFLVKAALINISSQIFMLVLTYNLAYSLNEQDLFFYRIVERGTITFKTLQSLITTRSIVEIKNRKNLTGDVTIKSKYYSLKLSVLFIFLCVLILSIVQRLHLIAFDYYYITLSSVIIYYSSYIFSIMVGPVGTLLMLTSGENISLIVHITCSLLLTTLLFLSQSFIVIALTVEFGLLLGSFNIIILNLLLYLSSRIINDHRPS